MRRTIALAMLLLPMSLACLVAGCSSSSSSLMAEEGASPAVWFPHAEASLATIGRSTRYSVVHAADTELLVYEQPLPREDGRASRLTWLVSIPSSMPANARTSLDGGDGAGAPSGWVIEEIEGERAHAARLAGDVTVAGRSAESLTAVLAVRAAGDRANAGEAMDTSVTLGRRVVFERRGARSPQDAELATRAGESPSDAMAGEDE